MYEAPIELIKMQNDMMMDIHRKLAEEQETYIMQSIEKVGVNVNKDELIKALAYDRGQYDKGYADGVNDGIKGFAERLKETIPHFSDGYTMIKCVEGTIKYLIGELTGETFTKVEHDSLCETETYGTKRNGKEQ